MKKIESANKIIVAISIILLIAIAGVVGFKYYNANFKDNNENKSVTNEIV